MKEESVPATPGPLAEEVWEITELFKGCRQAFRAYGPNAIVAVPIPLHMSLRASGSYSEDFIPGFHSAGLGFKSDLAANVMAHAAEKLYRIAYQKLSLAEGPALPESNPNPIPNPREGA